MNDSEKGGKSRQLQYEDWKRYFTWEKPTNKSYLIREIFNPPLEKQDGRIHNGGSRAGAGAKGKLTEEFKYLLNCFLYDALKKNSYYRLYGYGNRVYFNSDVAAKYFGCYKNLYAAKYDINVKQEIFFRISDKIREKVRALILEKMKRTEGIKWEYGIILWHKENGSPEVRDELLVPWLEAQQKYFEETGFKTEKDVVVADKWNDMLHSITAKLSMITDEVIFEAKKFYKLEFNTEQVQPYDFKLYQEYRKRINHQIMIDVYNFFLSREENLARNSAPKGIILNMDKLNGQKNPEELDIDEIVDLMDGNNEYDEYEFNSDIIMEPYKYILKNYIALF